MSARVIVFRRCGCVGAQTGRQLGRACRRLAEADHGSWYFAVQVPTVGGRRARHRRGGYASPEAARTAGHAVVDSEPVDMASQAWSVARWLQFWLGSVQLRPSTVNSYRQHVCRYLIPVLGRLRLDELTVHRVQACFDLLARRRTGTGARISPATVDRIRATLRSALNTAVREG
jgi:hypothetical protein